MDSHTPPLRTLGRYRLSDILGKGGMGVVYRGFDTLLERPVAVKVIGSQIDSSQDTRERFFREARSAGQLAHKNIVTIHDLGEQDGHPFIAMEYLEGEDLQQRLGSQVKMSAGRKLDIAIELCEGLEYAHAHGVIHRDVKPANVFLTTSGQVKILDFGLARLATSQLTHSNMLMGTLNYMAPEQVRGDRADHRADIFSVGVVLYELFGHRKAFEGDSFASTLYKILQEAPQPLWQVEATVPRALAAIVERALAKPLDERYQTMGALRQDLQVYREQIRAMDGGSGAVAHATAALVMPGSSIGSAPGSGAPGPLAAAGSAASASPITVAPDIAVAGAAAGGAAPQAAAPPAARPRRGMARYAGIPAAAIGVGAAVWWFASRSAAPVPVAQETAAHETVAPQTAARETIAPQTAAREASAAAAGAAAVSSRGAVPAQPSGGTSAPGAGSVAQTPAPPRTREAATSRPTRSAAPVGASGAEPPKEPTGPTGASAPGPAPASSPAALEPANTGTPPAAGEPPSPAAPASAAAPAPAAVGDAVQTRGPSAEEGVQQLLAQYRGALEARDLDALKRVWPGLGGAAAEALRAEFQHASRISVDILDPRIAVAGASATATFRRRYELLTRDGQRLRTETLTTLTARKTASAWIIESVRFSAPR